MSELWQVRRPKPPAPASVFLRDQGPTDTDFCHLCLDKTAKLTREHIPPRAAFNSENRRWHTLPIGKEVAKPNSLREVFIKGGYHRRVLCTTCNSGRCSRYAREYANFTKYLDSAAMILDERGEARLFATPFNRLILAKQIAVMVLALETAGFVLKQDRLRRFALDPDRTADPGFRIFAFLVPKSPITGNLQRYQGRLDFNYPASTFLAGEISLYPFGIVYATKLGAGYRPEKLTEITSWFTGEVQHGPLRLYTRPTVIASKAVAAGFPLDRPQIDYV